ncbi:maleylpyruvate isomerase family mycothiol-dependent enzyme [Mycolicibacter heraklionensis]|uniref:Maleylpyruvate isomerase family mycothiol-dependent enzyme n=1 Tax=Mycolicibacter heraklionensis TaxID=512402 RepID=A0A9X7WKY0_9MYCO|nr:maleylpyruvate isomerase family mycothiol-dependent enzyme [Mycolicibacter heraklionensis]QZA09797.1 maleylpyruvate isomerase family mycothiol-dependent enzyme [Mycolicibacter heraklionensis]
MALAEDVAAERAALTDALSATGASAPAGCGTWTARDLAAHLVAQERLGGLSTFVARSLVARRIAVPAPPWLVEFAIRREHASGFTDLIDRLRLPVPRLLLRSRVAPLTLFEYWTHHDDLAAVNAAVHAAPPTLVQAIPPLLRYQFAKLPAGVAVTVGTDDGRVLASVGPRAEQAVLVRGTPANLVRWLAGRHTRADVELAGPAVRVQELRTFEGHV